MSAIEYIGKSRRVGRFRNWESFAGFVAFIVGINLTVRIRDGVSSTNDWMIVLAIVILVGIVMPYTLLMSPRRRMEALGPSLSFLRQTPCNQ
jgi:hypothetical protein